MFVEDDMKTARRVPMLLAAAAFVLSCATVGGAQEIGKPSNTFYQAYVVAPSYEYELSGRKDRVKGYVVRLDDPQRLSSPGLVVLVSGIEPGEGYLTVNGHRYDLPGLLGETAGANRDKEKNQPGKEGWYSFTSGDDITGEVVIPLDPTHLQIGVNEIEFFKGPAADGYEVIDARLQSVPQSVPTLIGQTYHLLGRGRGATIRDFDFVLNYRSEKKRLPQDIPEWARRGRVNFYRAGIDWNHLDRMFEMFKEAHINLVATHVPRDTS